MLGGLHDGLDVASVEHNVEYYLVKVSIILQSALLVRRQVRLEAEVGLLVAQLGLHLGVLSQQGAVHGQLCVYLRQGGVTLLPLVALEVQVLV